MKYIGNDPGPGEAVVYGYRMGGEGDFFYIGTTKTSMKSRCSAQRTSSNPTQISLTNMINENFDKVVMVSLGVCSESDRFSMEKKVIEIALREGHSLLNSSYVKPRGGGMEGRKVNRKTHCKWGHEFTEENTSEHVNADGHTVRSCKTCAAERRQSVAYKEDQKRRREERKEMANSGCHGEWSY